jgi:hypothetical protein
MHAKRHTGPDLTYPSVSSTPVVHRKELFARDLNSFMAQHNSNIISPPLRPVIEDKLSPQENQPEQFYANHRNLAIQTANLCGQSGLVTPCETPIMSPVSQLGI